MSPQSSDQPLSPLIEFLKQEKVLEKSKEYEKLRFVGYALEIGYEETVIITSDPYKINVGGIPRNSFLIMVPDNDEAFPPHFIIIQVLDASETPLRQEVQQTYFELHKKSMPELDRFTQSELQWGALKTAVLGMFYYNPDESEKIEFSHDLVNYVSPHKYRIYSPTKEILEIITNALLPNENQFSIGKLRTTENRFPVNEQSFPDVDIKVSTKDLLGIRTALFGKTRLGKSNTVKIIAESIIKTTEGKNVGQLIFDIDGEYANDNLQDNRASLFSAYEDRCEVYSFNPKNDKQKQLKFNFYTTPEESIKIIRDLLIDDDSHRGDYVKAFTEIDLLSIGEINSLEDRGEQSRCRKQVLMYWAILIKAGFPIEFAQLNSIIRLDGNNTNAARYNQEILDAAYEAAHQDRPDTITSLTQLQTEFEIIARFRRNPGTHTNLLTNDEGRNHFEANETGLLEFLDPRGGRSGPSKLASYRKYHSVEGGDSVSEIIVHLRNKTVILDLSNAHPSVLRYFSLKLAKAVFHHLEEKFSNNKLEEDEFIQLYFEEAHNLFPENESDDVDEIYKRIAKEGAKFHIGMVYSTQSITSIDSDLLAQTENFFIAHLSSQEQVRALIKTNIFFENYERDILKAKRVGYLRIMTQSHRFVIPVQINPFIPLNKISGQNTESSSGTTQTESNVGGD